MANIIGYISNVGKSVGYSAVDKVKEMAPSVGSFSESNAELFKSVYSNVRNYRLTINRSKEYIQKSKYYQAADQMKASIVEDLRNGTFYNKRRIDEMNIKAMGSMADMGTMDVSVDDNFNSDDFNLDDDWGETELDPVSSAVANASKISGELVSDTVVRSAEYLGDIQKTNATMQYTQNMQAFNRIHGDMANLNGNLANIVTFMSKSIQAHLDNSKKYYEETTKLLQDQTALLREIKAASMPVQEQQQTKRKTQFSDLVDVNGMVNLTDYLGVVKNNAKNKMSTISMIDNIMGGDSNLLLTFAGAPLKFITDALVNQIIPATVEEAANKLNTTMGGFFGALMGKLNYLSQDDGANPLTKFFADIFGVKSNLKTSIETNNYIKGKVEWTGTSKKALEVVIPTQLSKIISLLSGKPETTYDYESGRFVEAHGIKKRVDSELTNAINSAFSDLRGYIDEVFNADIVRFNSLNEKEQMRKDFEKIMKKIFESGYFDVNNTKDKNMYLDYGVDAKTFEAFRQFYKNAERSGIQMQIGKNVYEARDRYTNAMIRREQNQSSVEQLLYNGSNIDEFVKRDKNGNILQGSAALVSNLNNVLDKKGNNVFYYLQNMYRELQYIRMYGVLNSGSTTNNKFSFDLPDGANTTDEFIYKNGVMYNNPYYGLQDPRKMNLEYKTTIRNNINKDKNYERRIRQNEKYLEHLRRLDAKSKQSRTGYITTNISELDDEQIKAHVGGTLRDYNDRVEAKKVLERTQNKKLIDKLLQATSVFDKVTILTKSVSDIAQAPMKTISNIITAVDTRLYEVIYGTNEEGGFLKHITNSIKGSFKRMNDWIDEKILTPMKNRFQADSMKEVINKFFEGMGINIPEIIRKVQDYFTGDDGIFAAIKNSIKDTFKNAWEGVKDAVTDVFAPLNNKLADRKRKIDAERARRKNTNEGNDQEEDGGTSDSPTVNNGPDIQAERQREINRDKELLEVYKKNARNRLDVMQQAITKNLGLDELNLNIDPDLLAKYNSNPQKYEKEYRAAVKANREKRKQNQDGINSIFNNILENVYVKQRSTNKSIDDITGQLTVNDILTWSQMDPNISMSMKQKILNSINTYKSKNRDISNETSIVDFIESFNKQRQQSIFETMSDEEFNALTNRKGKNTQAQPDLKPTIDTSNKILADIRQILLYLVPGVKKKVYKTQDDIDTSFKDLIEDQGNEAETEAGQSFAQRIMQSISKEINAIPRYAGGSDVIDKAHAAIVGQGEIVLNQETVKEMMEAMKSQPSVIAGMNEALDKMQETARIIVGRDPGKYTDENGIKNGKISDIAKQAGEELKTFTNKVQTVMIGENLDKQKDQLDNAVADVTKNISKYAPDMIASGLLGGGISLLTGAIGGPLLGAAVGASISLTKNSDKLQEYLFGEFGEDGERKGGLISANTQKALGKFLPDMKSYGIVGGLAGLLPMLPFGPVGGLFLGSALGFAKNTDVVQERLFGESGLIDPKKQEKIKKMVPRAVAGMVPSLFLGPFGLMGNAVLGASLGILSTNKNVEKFIFGEKSQVTGKYENGLLPTVRNHVLTPINNFFKRLSNTFFDWLEENIFKPVQSAFKPITKQINVIFESIANGIKDSFNKMIDDAIGVPVRKLIDRITKHISSMISKVVGTILKPFKLAIAAPFKMIGALGNTLRGRQIRKGNADYMTAAERNQYRKDKNIHGLFGRKSDKYAEFDKTLELMSNENLEQLAEQLKRTNVTSRDITKKKNQIRDEIGSEISAYFERYNGFIGASRGANAKSAMQLVNKGDLDGAITMVRNQNKAKQDTSDRVLKRIREVTDQYEEGATIPYKDRAAILKYVSKNIDDPNILAKIGKNLKSNNPEKVLEIIENKKKSDIAEQDRLIGFLSTKNNLYKSLKDGDKGAKAIRDEAMAYLQNFKGFERIDDTKKLQKILEAEIKQRAANKEPDVADKINEELSEQEKRQQAATNKRHSELVDLFKEAISGLNDINKSITGEEIRNEGMEHLKRQDPSLLEKVGQEVKANHEYDEDSFRFTRSDIGYNIGKGGRITKKFIKGSAKNIKGVHKNIADFNNRIINTLGYLGEDNAKDVWKAIAKLDGHSQTKFINTVDDIVLAATGKPRTNIKNIKYSTSNVENLNNIMNDVASRSYNQTTQDRFLDQLTQINNTLTANQRQLEIINDNTEVETDKSFVQYTPNGAIRYKRTMSGETAVIDRQDSDTRETLEKQEEDRNVNRGILDTLKTNLSGIGTWFKNLFSKGKKEDDTKKPGFFSKMMDAMMGNKYVSGFLKGLVGVGGTILTLPLFDRIIDFVSPYIQKLWGSTKSYLNEHPDIIQNAVSSVFEFGSSILECVKDFVVKNSKRLVGGIVDTVGWTITELLPSLGSGILDYVKEAVEDAGGLMNMIFGWGKSKQKSKYSTDTSKMEDLQDGRYKANLAGGGYYIYNPEDNSFTEYDANGLQKYTTVNSKDGSSTRTYTNGVVEKYNKSKDKQYTYNVNGDLVKTVDQSPNIITRADNILSGLTHNVGYGGQNYSETGFIQNTINKSLQQALTKKQIVQKGAKILDKTSKAASYVPRVIPGIGKTASKIVKTAGSGASKAINKAGDVADSIVKDGFITKIMNSIRKMIKNIFTSKILQKVLSAEKCAKLYKFFTSKMDDLIDLISKCSTSKLGSAVGKIGSKVFTAVFSAYYAVSAYADAENILGVDEEYVKWYHRGLCAVFKVLYEFTPLSILVSYESIVGLFLDNIDVFFGEDENDEDSLSYQRDKLQKEVDKYNKENDTKYTVSEYNEIVKGNTSLTNKIKNLVTGKNNKKATPEGNGLTASTPEAKEYNKKHGTNFSDAKIQEINAYKKSKNTKYGTIDNYLEAMGLEKSSLNYYKAIGENEKYDGTLFADDETSLKYKEERTQKTNNYNKNGSSVSGFTANLMGQNNRINTTNKALGKDPLILTAPGPVDKSVKDSSKSSDSSGAAKQIMAQMPNRFSLINQTIGSFEENKNKAKEDASITLANGITIDATKEELDEYGNELYTQKYNETLLGVDSENYTKAIDAISSNRDSIAKVAESGWKNVYNNVKKIFSNANTQLLGGSLDIANIGITTKGGKTVSINDTSKSSSKSSSSSKKKKTTTSTSSYQNAINSNPFLSGMGGIIVDPKTYTKSVDKMNEIKGIATKTRSINKAQIEDYSKRNSTDIKTKYGVGTGTWQDQVNIAANASNKKNNKVTSTSNADGSTTYTDAKGNHYTQRSNTPLTVANIADHNMTYYDPISANELSDYLSTVGNSNRFVTQRNTFAQYFKEAGDVSGIDPRALLAIAANESGWGGNSISNDKNNFFSINATNVNPYGNAYTWSTPREGIVNGASWIRQYYTDAGQNTLNSMIDPATNHVYARNDDGSINTRWRDVISQIWASIPNTTTFVPGTASNVAATGVTGTGTSEDGMEEQSGILGFISGLANLASNTINRIYGFDTATTSSDSSSASSGAMTVTDAGATEVGKKVSQLAMSKIGCRYTQQQGYRTGPDSFDCSGLCWWAYNQVTGTNIGTWTGEQDNDSLNPKVGTLDDIKPGDIILCNYSGGVSGHVGMYVGNNQVVHAANTARGVVMDPLPDFIASHGRYTIRRPKAAIGGVDKKVSSSIASKIGSILNNKDEQNYNKSNNWFAQTLKTGGVVTSNFGIRQNPFGEGYTNHTGVDYGSDEGTPINSPIEGEVVSNNSPMTSGGYGNLVVVQDKNGAQHLFGHMKERSPLQPGTKINKGQELGKVGSTGNSTGPHLHYETRVDNIPVDPNEYLDTIYGQGGQDSPIYNDIEAIRQSVDKNISIIREKEHKRKSSTKAQGGVDTPVSKTASALSSLDPTIIKLLTSMLSVLNKVADNTNLLSQVVSLLSGVSGQSNNTTANTSKSSGNRVSATAKASSVESSDMDIQSILNLMTQLATE